MREVQIIYSDPEQNIYAIDYGGAYVDLYSNAQNIHNEDLAPFDAINCWDYEKGARSKDCPFTPSNLKQLVTDYLKEYEIKWWENE